MVGHITSDISHTQIGHQKRVLHARSRERKLATFRGPGGEALNLHAEAKCHWNRSRCLSTSLTKKIAVKEKNVDER